jgi:hypothetical protein
VILVSCAPRHDTTAVDDGASPLSYNDDVSASDVTSRIQTSLALPPNCDNGNLPDVRTTAVTL